MKRTVEVQIPEDQVNQAATMFIKTANEFTSYILVTRNGNSVNAKSLLGLLSMRLEYGMPIDITAEGIDAEEALSALEKVLDPTDHN